MNALVVIRNGVLALFAVMLAACSALPPSETMPPASELEPEAYEIGVGDTVTVHVWRNPELGQSITVRPDGYISLPLMGDVKAEGKRPEELASEITLGLADYIRTPEVTVMVTNPVSKEFRNRIRITGQVMSPQSVAFQPGMTVLDLVLLAGGLTDFAADGRATLTRMLTASTRATAWTWAPC